MTILERKERRIAMKRSDIRGFTLKVGRWWIEVVTVHHIPTGFSVWHRGNRELKWRIEI